MMPTKWKMASGATVNESDLLALIDSFYEAAFNECVWPMVLNGFAHAFGGPGATIVNLSTDPPLVNTAANLEEGVAAYQALWWQKDSYLQYARRDRNPDRALIVVDRSPIHDLPTPVQADECKILRRLAAHRVSMQLCDSKVAGTVDELDLGRKCAVAGDSAHMFTAFDEVRGRMPFEVIVVAPR